MCIDQERVSLLVEICIVRKLFVMLFFNIVMLGRSSVRCFIKVKGIKILRLYLKDQNISTLTN